VKAVVKSRRAPGGEVIEVPEPVPREREVLVRVLASSVCGTDLHIWKWNPWAESRIQRLPLIIGHELCGEVVRLGPGVQGLSVGDRVTAETHLVDGTCYQCRTGRMNVCENVQVLGVDRDGVFAEFAVLPELNAWKNDPGLDPAIAAIQEPLGNAMHSLLPESSDEDGIAGKHLLVTGCGPIGLMAILAGRALGAETIVATEVNPMRAELARSFGADLVLRPGADGADLAAAVRAASGGHGADVALEMSGHPTSLKLVFDALRPGGRVSLLGLFDRPATLDFDNAVVFKAARIHGIFGRRMFDTWYQVKGLLALPAFREKVARVITHRVPIPEIARAMELIESGQAAKVSLEAKW
jgi:threonine 3-dehydrogenase